MTDTPSILNAFNLINKDKQGNTPTGAPATLPTAKSRNALNVLVHSTPDALKGIALKPFLQDLFNWDGNNHVNKPLIRAFEQAVNTPLRYPQAVEFTAFAAAFAPLLEADQLARMYSVVERTETAFGPSLYTLRFSTNVQRAFAGLSSARVEKIAVSLWEEAHNGRWWNMTAGVRNDNAENGATMTGTQILHSLLIYQKVVRGEETLPEEGVDNLTWTRENQRRFHEYMSTRLDQNLAMLAEDFRKDLMSGNAVNPDTAIFLSAIDWLAPNQRPESPISSLVRHLTEIREKDTFTMPKKPNTITDLFPSIDFSTFGAEKIEFLMDHTILREAFPGGQLYREVQKMGGELSVITNKDQLARNANHMGNCTMSFHSHMDQGTYVLFHMKFDSGEYNAAIVMSSPQRGSWHLQEINSRHNRGNVPTEVRELVNRLLHRIPNSSPEFLEAVNKKSGKKNENATQHIYRYTID